MNSQITFKAKISNYNTFIHLQNRPRVMKGSQFDPNLLLKEQRTVIVWNKNSLSCCKQLRAE